MTTGKPFRRIVMGTLMERRSAEAMMPRATMAQSTIPPKIFTRIDFTYTGLCAMEVSRAEYKEQKKDAE